MYDVFEDTSKYYDVIPEYNSAGRLCNFHTGEGKAVRVLSDEWERFNQLAGRQHKVMEGQVIYDPDLVPCLPDSADSVSETDMLMLAVAEVYEHNLALQEENMSIMLAIAELYEQMIGG